MIKEYVKGCKVWLSKNFTTDEFHCKCLNYECKVTYIDTDLIDYLQRKRDLWGEPIIVLSGFRCTTNNRMNGGAPGSKHLVGQAADIRVRNLPMRKILDDCSDAGGLGKYSTFTHVDVRTKRARW